MSTTLFFRWISSTYLPEREGWFMAGPTITFEAEDLDDFIEQGVLAYREARNVSFGWNPVEKIWHFPTLKLEICLLRHMEGRKRWPRECWWYQFSRGGAILSHRAVSDPDRRWQELPKSDKDWFVEQAPKLWQAAHGVAAHYKLPFGVPTGI